MDVISTAKSPACARCGNPIGTSSIIEGDRYWHPECHSSFSDSASRAFYAAPTMRKEEQPIVERLKRAADDALLNENWDDLDAVERLLREAAGWGEALQQRATTTESEASALRKRVEELESALRPFGEAGRAMRFTGGVNPKLSGPRLAEHLELARTLTEGGNNAG